MPWIKHSLGISLEGDLLHLVFLRSSLRGPRFLDRAAFPFPATRADGERLGPDIQKFLLHCGAGPLDEVTLGIPRAAIFFRHISTPAVKEKDLNALLRYEYERHLPGKREDFVVGHTALGSAEDGGHRLLLGAAGRAKIDEYLDVLSAANLKPRSLQPATMALAAAFRHAQPQERTALLISAEKDFFNADYIEGGRVMLSRRFSHRAPPGEGEEPGDLPSAPRRLAAALGERLRQGPFLDSLPGGQLPPLWLYGFGREEAAVAELLEPRLDTPARVFSPLKGLQVGGDGASGIAFGLALIGLGGGRGGLELSEERAEMLREGPDFRSTAVIAAFLLVMVLGFYGFRALQNTRYVARLDREVETLRVRKENVEALSSRVQKKRQRLEYLASTVVNRVRQADLLKELTVLIPEDTHLTNYSFKSGGLEIDGLSPSASQLLSILEESPLFMGARFSSAIVSQGKTHERFKIHLDLEEGDG